MLGWRSCRDSNVVVWEYPALIRRGSCLRARLAGICSADGALRHSYSGGVDNQFSHRGTAMLGVCARRLLRNATAIFRGGEQSAAATSSASSVVYHYFVHSHSPVIGREFTGTADGGRGDLRCVGGIVCGDGPRRARTL